MLEAALALDNPISTEGNNIFFYIGQNVMDNFESVSLEITQEFLNAIKY